MTEKINALAIYAGLDTYPTNGVDASINHAITIIFNKIENAFANSTRQIQVHKSKR